MYEIHVLIDPMQEKAMLSEVGKVQQTHPELHSCKVMATLTSTGVSPRQPMVSGFYSADNAEDAIAYADRVASTVTDMGYEVVRIKVEYLVNLTDLPAEVYGDNYYEAHVKVGSSMPTPERYRLLAEICLKYGIQLLVNPYSIKMAPVTTMRMYDANASAFAAKHGAFLSDLEANGFTMYKQHLEMGVHDTNVYTDAGWLFHDKGYYTRPITEVDCPERLMAPVLPLVSVAST